MQTSAEPKQKTLSNMSDKDIMITEKAVAEKNPLYLLLSEYLSIKTKKGDLIKLKLNAMQRKFHKLIVEKRRNKEHIRIWLLKFRQGGSSTYIEALIYALTSQQPNRNSLIMADEKDKSDYLFQMSKLYQEQLTEDRPYLTPTLKKSNAKALEFEGIKSQIIIESAENIKAARAFTYQYVHLSEVAFFPDLKGVLDALNQSVPDHQDTLIIGETTANGMNYFHKEWVRAIQSKTDWIPLFLGWFMMDEYRMPLENGRLYPLKGINFEADSSERMFEAEEDDLRVEYGLDEEQVNWRRWAIVNKCQGSVTTFKAEYPFTWQEAFATSGDLFFDKKGLERQVVHKVLTIGDLFYQGMKYEFRDMPLGKIEVYEKPIVGEQYIVTLDASEAIGSDEASILVLNKRTNATAAIVAGQYTPEDLAQIGIALGNWYNTALVVPENKGYGYMVCQLVNQKYGNIYKVAKTRTGEVKQTEELGFNTNVVTRPQMLAQLNEELKNSSTEFKSKRLLDQCQTFIIKKDKQGKVTKIEAQSGCQDGLVICRAIAGYVRQQFPFTNVSKTSRDKRKALKHRLSERKNAGIKF